MVARSFSASVSRYDSHSSAPVDTSKIKSISEIKDEHDLLPPGAPVGTIPTDLNQATGLERLEIIGKMQGVDIWDMRPLDASRKGTMEEPIQVNSHGHEQYVGCTGFPADSHGTTWLTVSRDRPIERCGHCGNVYKMNYIGPEHDHHHTPDWEPKTFGDYVKPDYLYK